MVNLVLPVAYGMGMDTVSLKTGFVDIAFDDPVYSLALRCLDNQD